ncbi:MULTISPECIES: thioredoxin family protein [unclassified Flavobacterium]|uniref:thioredoxin family protein n=1 Tax=unclassified Flavobacterium TaxID=196869 RepID=UPI00361D3D42
MKKITTILLASFAVISCKTNQTVIEKAAPIVMEEKTVSENHEKSAEPVLTGVKTKADLQTEPYNSWFTTGEEGYKAHPATITLLKNAPQNYEITIFMGTWCSDSKTQVPHFYKILNEIGFDLSKVKLITMDREKSTPEKLEEGFSISNVPTFIFFKNGKEVHRIVESPVETLEADMLKIISEQPYKHTYEN